MKVKNSLQVEPLPDGLIPRVLISYYRTIMQIEEYNLVSRLTTDLRSVGIDVLLDEIQDIRIPLTINLQPRDWVLLVQTKDISSSNLVKARMMHALAQNGRQEVQKILFLFVSASNSPTSLPGIDRANTFDAGIDYLRAFAGIMLTIQPNKQKHLYGIGSGTTPPIVAPRSLASLHLLSDVIPASSFRSKPIARSRHPLYTTGIMLIGGLILLLIIFHSFVLSSAKTTPIKTTQLQTTNTRTTAKNQHTNTMKVIPTATITPENLYKQVTSRAPIINDPLQNQSANQWDIMQQQGVSCSFTNGSYHDSIIPPSKAPKRHACMAEGPVFANLALQVDMQLLQGDVGGLIFRANGRSSYYWFSLDSRGCYRFVLLTAQGQAQILSQDQFSCLAINMQNVNQLTVLAQNSNIYLYINGNFIHQFSDSSFTKGQIGLVAIDRTRPTIVAFSNLKVWQLA